VGVVRVIIFFNIFFSLSPRASVFLTFFFWFVSNVRGDSERLIQSIFGREGRDSREMRERKREKNVSMTIILLSLSALSLFTHSLHLKRPTWQRH